MKWYEWFWMGPLAFACYYTAFMMAVTFSLVILPVGVLIGAIRWSDYPDFWRFCFSLEFLESH